MGKEPACAPSLAREIGLFGATMLVMGGIVGSGIFMNPYVVAGQVGTPALILAAWSFGGLVALWRWACPSTGCGRAAAARPPPWYRLDGGGLQEFLMSEYVPVLSVAELPPGQAAEVKVGEQAVALFNVGGTFHALTNLCPHRGGPLGQGFLEGSEVSCPWHNYTFDVRTGENVVNAELKVARYDVKVEDGRVFVKVG